MPSTSPTDLREADLIDSAGAIDRELLMQVAAQRARRELAAYAAMGSPRPWRELIGEELARGWSLAHLMRACAAGRRAFAGLPPAEQRIRQLELRLAILRDGLATPACAKTRDDIAHHEALLERARAAGAAAMAEAAE